MISVRTFPSPENLTYPWKICLPTVYFRSDRILNIGLRIVYAAGRRFRYPITITGFRASFIVHLFDAGSDEHDVHATYAQLVDDQEPVDDQPAEENNRNLSSIYSKRFFIIIFLVCFFFVFGETSVFALLAVY